jgi:hypothetical protein
MNYISTVLLKLALFLTLFFAACIGLIRAQLYDDSELRAFLTPPEGCPIPCFMGIRPGVTTAEEALAILEAHEWVGEITFLPPERFAWKWNGRQPEMLNRSSGIDDGHISLNPDNTVYLVVVPTRIRFGDISLFYNHPPLYDSQTIRINRIDFWRDESCTGSPSYYWHIPVTIAAVDYSVFDGVMRLGPIPCSIARHHR